MLVRAPLGTGARGVLVPQIIAAATSGIVLIAAPTFAQLEQWARRIRDAGGPEARYINKDTALEFADKSSTQLTTGILLTAHLASLRGPARTVVEKMSLRLCLADGSSMVSDQFRAVPDFLGRAARTVVLDDHTNATSGWLSSATVVEITLDEVTGQRPTATVVSTFSVHLNPAERELLASAERLLNLSQPTSLSRAALHAQLMNLVSEPASTQCGAARDLPEVWLTIDQLEALGEDPRLSAVFDLATSLRASATVFIVTSLLAADVTYLHGYLISRGVEAILWTRFSPLQFVSPAPGPPHPVVVASASLDMDDEALDGSHLVFLAEPLGEQVRRVREVAATGTVRSIHLPDTSCSTQPDLLD